MKGKKQWWACGVALACALGGGGCVTPNVRYTRPSRQTMAETQSYKVPKNWDYRKHYKVPADRLIKIIETYMGTPYRYGGTSRKGMDCSGFVIVVFNKLNRARLPRSSNAMSRLGRPVAQQDARPGDLVFFRGGMLNRINHVGIYVGEKKFAHASRSKGVMYSMLDSEYFIKHFAGIRRLF